MEKHHSVISSYSMPRITHILNQEVAEVDGHMYHLLEAETELSITKRLLSGITAPALALCGQWEEAVERLAIDLTEEKSITRTALQLQLIPALDPTKKNNVWTGVLTKGIKEQLHDMISSGLLTIAIRERQQVIHAQKSTFQGKAIITLEDPLFQRAFKEVFYKQAIDPSNYGWE